MSNKNTKRGRQWEEGVVLPISDSFFITKDKARVPITEKVYKELRRMILNDEIDPGSWLRQDTLTRQLGVSSTPVREALRTLHREGLVDIIPNYGVKVSDLSIEEFEEIYALRKGIEGLAARRGVMKLSLEKLSTLKAMYEDLVPLADHATLAKYLKDEWHFRYWLYERVKREAFLSQIRDLRERAERYLRYAYIKENSIHTSLEFHHELLWHCEKGDPEKAEIVVQRALNWTLETAGPIIASKLKEHEGEWE